MARISKKEQQELQVRGAVKKYLPYALFRNAENGKVIFVNRHYEVMDFFGQREFDIDIEKLGIEFDYEADEMFLLPEDGTSYVGMFFFLYTDANSPYYFYKRDVIDYFEKLEKVMAQMVICLGNAFNNATATEEQLKDLEVLFDSRFIH